MGFKLKKSSAKNFLTAWFQMKKMQEQERMNQAKLAYFAQKGENERQKMEMDAAYKGQKLQYEGARTQGTLANLMDQARHRKITEELNQAKFMRMQAVQAERLSNEKTRTSWYVKNAQLSALSKGMEIEQKKATQQFTKELFGAGKEIAENKDLATSAEKNTILGSRAAELLDQIPGVDPKGAFNAAKAASGLMFPKQKISLKMTTNPDGEVLVHSIDETGRKVHEEKIGLDDKHTLSQMRAVMQLQNSYQQELRSKAGMAHQRFGLANFDAKVTPESAVKDLDSIMGETQKQMGSERDYITKRLKGANPKVLEWYDKVLAPTSPLDVGAKDEGTKKLRDKLLGYAGNPNFWSIVKQMKGDVQKSPEIMLMLDRALDSIYQDFNMHDPEDLDKSVDFSDDAEKFELDHADEDDWAD